VELRDAPEERPGDDAVADERLVLEHPRYDDQGRDLRAGSLAQVRANFLVRRARRAPLERLAHRGDEGLVQDDAAVLELPAERDAPARPLALRLQSRVSRLDALARRAAMVLRDHSQHPRGEPRAGRGRGDFADVEREHASARGLDALQDFSLYDERADEPVEVRDDEDGRLAALDSLDGLAESRALRERSPAAHVLLFEHADEREPLALAVLADPRDLLRDGLRRFVSSRLSRYADCVRLAHVLSLLVHRGLVRGDQFSLSVRLVLHLNERARAPA
jgi:hypothetical protein